MDVWERKHRQMRLARWSAAHALLATIGAVAALAWGFWLFAAGFVVFALIDVRMMRKNYRRARAQF
jgi:hypothetical protein